jgi:MerR family transcriptional regulator, copper efflux regulator
MTEATRTLKTGDLAESAGVNIHTVRYYESRGLLPKPPRTGSGYRMYGEEDVKRLRFIKRAQELGFTLEEISELLGLRVVPGAGAEVRSRTGSKIEEIDGKIRDLERIRAKLVELSEACDHHGSSDACLVLHALEDH